MEEPIVVFSLRSHEPVVEVVELACVDVVDGLDVEPWEPERHGPGVHAVDIDVGDAAFGARVVCVVPKYLRHASVVVVALDCCGCRRLIVAYLTLPDEVPLEVVGSQLWAGGDSVELAEGDGSAHRPLGKKHFSPAFVTHVI